uniref:Uncharacterized protein n=1 Tax=Meloidogyne incognita TaxID=6306 RepID=A0A914KH68_MELIC
MVVQNQGQTQHNPHLGLQHIHHPIQASLGYQQLPIVPYHNPPQNQGYFDQLANAFGPQNELAPQKVENSLHPEFLNLRRTVNNVLRQIMSEFIIGFRYNSYESVDKEFAVINEEALDMLASEYIENLKKLYDKVTTEAVLNDVFNIEIEGWAQHLTDLSFGGFEEAVGKPRTKEIEEIEEFVRHDYKGLDKGFKQSRAIGDEIATKSNNDEFNRAFFELWNSVPNKIPIVQLPDAKRRMMQGVIADLKEFYSQVNSIYFNAYNHEKALKVRYDIFKYENLK